MPVLRSGICSAHFFGGLGWIPRRFQEMDKEVPAGGLAHLPTIVWMAPGPSQYPQALECDSALEQF